MNTYIIRYNISKIHRKTRIRITKIVRISVLKVFLLCMGSNPSNSRTPREYSENQDLGASMLLGKSLVFRDLGSYSVRHAGYT